MNKTLDTIKDKKMKLLKIGAIIFVAYSAISLVGVVGVYPTEEHRTVGGQIARHGVASDGLATMPVTESKEYKKLNATSEASYINNAAIIVSIVYLITSIVLIKYLYEYIRKYRLSEHASGITILIFTVIAIAVTIVTSYMESKYLDAPMTHAMLFIFGAIYSLISTLIVTISSSSGTTTANIVFLSSKTTPFV